MSRAEQPDWADDESDPRPWYQEEVHRIGADLGVDDPATHLTRLPELRAAAVAADDPLFAAEVDRMEGVLVAKSGELERARDLLTSARKVFLELGEWEVGAQALVDTAVLDYEEGQLARAAALCEIAAEIAALEPDPAFDDAADYSGAAAQCHLEAGDHVLASSTYRNAIDYALRAGSPGQAAVWCHDLGNTLERIGDETGALEQWRRCVDLDPIGDAASPAWSRISQIYRSQGVTSRAGEAADRALATAHDAAASRRARFHTLALAGEVDPKASVLADIRALRAEYLADDDAAAAASCMVLAAGLQHRIGRSAEATPLWEEAASEFAGLEDWMSLAGLHAEWATRLAEDRDTIGARRHLTQARDLYSRAGLQHDADRCEQNLGALTAPDDGDLIRQKYREVEQPRTRDEAHELLGLAGVEYGLQQFERAAEHARRARDFFVENGLPQGEFEARNLLAAIRAQSGQAEQALEEIQALLTAMDDAAYPMVRAQAMTVMGGIAAAQKQFGPAAVAYRAAIAILDQHHDGPGTSAYALAQLNLAVVTILSDPEEALRHASAASESFRRQGIVSYSARADLAAAHALTRIGAWQGAFDLAAPALLVTDILRAATTLPADRDRMREVWSVIHHTVLEMLNELDDPRLTAEILERLRANATVPQSQDAGEIDHPRSDLPIGPAGPIGNDVAIAWDAEWTAGAALLAAEEQLPIGPPPLVAMPWGIALEPYETIAAHRLLSLSERHRRARQVVTWADQIGFA